MKCYKSKGTVRKFCIIIVSTQIIMEIINTFILLDINTLLSTNLERLCSQLNIFVTEKSSVNQPHLGFRLHHPLLVHLHHHCQHPCPLQRHRRHHPQPDFLLVFHHHHFRSQCLRLQPRLLLPQVPALLVKELLPLQSL